LIKKVEEKKPVNPLVIEGRIIAPTREITLMERMKTLTEEILSYPRLIVLIKEL
ncbi:unnamed protein product, partial [marine sediment metagenome]